MSDSAKPDDLNGEQTPTGGGGPWFERLARRALGDVRIHDSRQAGELARRLGARGFTVGRDVYVRPELVRPLTPEGEALLAHEMYHVTEQSGQAAGEMPLLRPQAPAADGSTGTSADAGRAAPAQGTRPAVQRAATTAPSGLSSSEASAEAVERAVLQAQTGQEQGKPPAPPPDPEQVADRVYRLIVRDLLVDRERGAHGWQ